VGPRADLDVVVKGKFSPLCRDPNPRSSGPKSSAIPLSYPGFLHEQVQENNCRFLQRPRNYVLV